ncbi:SDR family NAD(P)-dependent oxidoreductase, partial [Gemmatimonas sp.]|uniref:SDR family NAD(P)-dependent oxidoreductase n=1 Tax=Gemmatimonas sp. TaxID=1962908 RepID=UPI0037C09091
MTAPARHAMAAARKTLITGAARPLGVELVRQCLMRGDKVYAAARNPARVPVLADLRAEYGGLELIALDPADPSLVADAVPVLESLTDTLDQLIIAPAEPGQHEKLADSERDELLSTLSGTGLTEHYRRHALAPLLLVRTLLPFLANRDGARVLVVSSWLGSLAGKTQGGDYATCTSHAALHMLMRALSHDLSEERIVLMLGNPGHFATTPDGPAFRVPIDEAASGLL